MAVKILIRRRVKPGQEEKFNELVRELRSRAMHLAGFISGETLRSIEDPSIHLVISTWKSIEDWNAWLKGPDRKAVKKKFEKVLAEPETMTPFQYE